MISIRLVCGLSLVMMDTAFINQSQKLNRESAMRFDASSNSSSNASLSASAVEQIISNGVPNFSEYGIRVEDVGNGRARLRQPFQQSQLRPGGTLSGPTMMGLADAAMYAAILAQLGRLEMAVTQNLNINFLTRPQASDLIAEAEIIRLGRRSAVLEVRLFSEGSEQMVAHVTGTYALPAASQPAAQEDGQ